ncbi:MAG: tRNA pseudouridine(55) synthase TruB [Wolbachia endosymbiont of Tyrophagus putrescentiae]|nr:tRNA pseudouridine(55) synthase TruB [Wolbachia endosymbiont of Tyrophagus putrescentiae]
MHGWLNIDKPVGISSAQVVNRIKKIFSVKKAGHLGTLDPLASGVLPVAIGEATKTIPYVHSDVKAYNFTVKWGQQTTTDDSEGEVIKNSSIKPGYEQINCATKSFIGEVMQIPPEFSAIKINGVRAYKFARAGQEINMKPRLVYIHELKLLSVDTMNNCANFSVVCGSGVYVRSIARDLGIVLNCFGHVTELRRTMVGDFKVEESVVVEQLAEDKVVSIASILKKTMLRIEISREEVKKIRDGQKIILNNLCNLKDCDICYIIMGDLPIAICSFICGYIKPIRVFNI